MNEELVVEAFKLISDAGDASSNFLMAIQEAESCNFEKAEEFLEIGKKSLVTAHKLQTELLQNEIRGEGVEYSLIMVHAQDHLMNAILLKDLTISIIKLNMKVKKLEG
ncbi:MAG: PTS lactose/cellobiose transporter subunit IIA [Longicatena sp.]